MPVPETISLPGRALGHVNLMLDTFIANASVEDLRAITRNLLATNPSSLTQSYKVCARNRLCRTDNTAELLSASLFQQREDSNYAPTPSLSELLSRTRKLYGVGLGSSSLPLLTAIVRATIGIRWRERGDTMTLLAVVDNDISQAVQSTKEEIASGLVEDVSLVQDAAEKLKRALMESRKDVETWNGKFPFGRAEVTLQCWKL
ncbi:hypothetical protein P691DRAFT_776508 [Macrolepiota fuliginosa MF-IS2]|uniref:Uncharacterized protein n=1 Tax=Macrolepiota fuliginosa MF-IS2 TaxID=1400762 RepID=A0A9P5XC83_9AGAR|nr:hypothetical protein P691DRAFT_776508 [Macrolepiota fuliginosa MF-IS2]